MVLLDLNFGPIDNYYTVASFIRTWKAESFICLDHPAPALLLLSVDIELIVQCLSSPLDCETHGGRNGVHLVFYSVPSA